MKIGMILDTVFPPDPRVENESISLSKAGHTVFLFCLTYQNEQLEEESNKIKIRRYKSNKLEYKLSALAYTIPLYSKIMQKKISHFIKKNKIEVLHIHDIRIAEAVFLANKKYKLPTVLDLHDNMPEIMKLYPHLQKFPGKYLISPKKWKIKENQFIKKADILITVSPEFINRLINRNNSIKEKVKLVPNSVRSSFYKEAIFDTKIIEKYKNQFVVLYLGDTNVRRGLKTAIEATTELSKKIKNFKLVIVGKNTTDNILKEQVKLLGLERFVNFEGWQNLNLFPSYIKISTICISPLYRNIQHDVAYANKLFQYMSFGKPILVSNAIAQKRLVEKVNSGLVHEERNINDFTKKVLKLYNDPKLCKQLGVNGKNFVRNEFSWEHTSKELIDLYNNLKN